MSVWQSNMHLRELACRCVLIVCTSVGWSHMQHPGARQCVAAGVSQLRLCQGFDVHKYENSPVQSCLHGQAGSPHPPHQAS
jgi:hypothetical protein